MRVDLRWPRAPDRLPWSRRSWYADRYPQTRLREPSDVSLRIVLGNGTIKLMTNNGKRIPPALARNCRGRMSGERSYHATPAIPNDLLEQIFQLQARVANVLRLAERAARAHSA
jgi:hypothetical protein